MRLLVEKEVRMRVIHAACAALWLSGCAHVGERPGGAQASRAGAPSGSASEGLPQKNALQATGIWDWVFRSNDEAGNLRVEQEEWHLVQKGRSLEGYYDRAVTLLSTDDRLFKCNQQLGYTRFTRVHVAGVVERGRLHVRELGYDAKPGPCDDGARSLVDYDGQLGATSIRLSWAAQGQQTLYRREGDGGPRLAQLVGADESIGQVGATAVERPHSSLPVTGVWQWELKSVDAEGDERVEREEWHLTENEDGISGWYDRKVVRMRGDGTYQCNGDSRFETSTRYDIEGHRIGDVVTLSEMGYKAAPSKCDNGARRLDTYQGSVAGAGDELILSWGSGNQVLRRRPALRTAAAPAN